MHFTHTDKHKHTWMSVSAVCFDGKNQIYNASNRIAIFFFVKNKITTTATIFNLLSVLFVIIRMYSWNMANFMNWNATFNVPLKGMSSAMYTYILGAEYSCLNNNKKRWPKNRMEWVFFVCLNVLYVQIDFAFVLCECANLIQNFIFHFFLKKKRDIFENEKPNTISFLVIIKKFLVFALQTKKAKMWS